MRHTFGLSPFPLTERRPSSSNKKRVEVVSASLDLPSDERSGEAVENRTNDPAKGTDQ